MGIILDQIGRDYRSQWAVRDVSATIDDGSMVAVLGANGAGKSTLLQLVAGWLPPATGRIQIDGHTMRLRSESVRRRLMLLGEPPRGDVSIVQMIGQAVNDYQVDRDGIEAEVADWFERLNLLGVYGRSANSTSKGQRYKIAMICLFIVRPKVWLLDEPFSAGLDVGGLQVLETEMAIHVHSGGIVVFSSQWPEHANRLAARSLVLHEGELVWDQTVGETPPADLIRSASPPLGAVLSGLVGNNGLVGNGNGSIADV